MSQEWQLQRAKKLGDAELIAAIERGIKKPEAKAAPAGAAKKEPCPCDKKGKKNA